MKPRVCVLCTDGINCDEETAYAFELAGGLPYKVHVNQLRSGADSLMNYGILVLPGGFSYGDDIASGAVLASELISQLRDQLLAFVEVGRLVLGICNGFQVLVRTGLLPFQTIGEQQVSLAPNDSGHFGCRDVHLSVAHTPCVFTQGLEGEELVLQVAHGEGRFTASPEIVRRIEDASLVPLRYALPSQSVVQCPYNPNGSIADIAAICNLTGRVLGLMPHPERFVVWEQHGNWRRKKRAKPHGLAIFENAVRYAA